MYRTNGEKIGTIQRLMIDKISGNVAYAVLRYGGLLGIGEKHMPLPWGKLKFEPLMHGYQVDMSDDEFAKAPSYAADKEFDWGRPQPRDAGTIIIGPGRIGSDRCRHPPVALREFIPGSVVQSTLMALSDRNRMSAFMSAIGG